MQLNQVYVFFGFIILFQNINVGENRHVKSFRRIRRKRSTCDDLIQQCVMTRNAPNLRVTRPPGNEPTHNIYGCTSANTQQRDDWRRELHVVSVYFSNMGTVKLDVSRLPGSSDAHSNVTLVLMSHDHVNWDVKATDDVIVHNVHVISKNLTNQRTTVNGKDDGFKKSHEISYYGFGRRKSLMWKFREGYLKRHKWDRYTSFSGTVEAGKLTLKVGINYECRHSIESCGARGVRPGSMHPADSVFDCEMFLLCANGSTGGGELYEMRCGTGTAWNPYSQACEAGDTCNTTAAAGGGAQCVNTGRHVCHVIPTLPQVDGCLEKDTCWTTFDFKHSEAFCNCTGKRYVSGTKYGLYVGVRLCSNRRYKLFLSDDLDSEFKDIADMAGHGEDHCEFVGGSSATAATSSDCHRSPSAEGYYRSTVGEFPKLAKIGLGVDVATFTPRLYPSWYECDVEIPGPGKVQPLLQIQLLVSKGDDGSLLCNATLPVGGSAHYYWYENEEESGSNGAPVTDGPHNTLNITAKRDKIDNKRIKYTCCVSQIGVFARRCSSLVLQSQSRRVCEEPLELSMQPNTTAVAYKRIVSAESRLCQLSVGNPSTRFEWYKNGKQDFETGPIQVKSSAVGNNYTCRVYNSWDSDACYTERSVYLLPQNCGEWKRDYWDSDGPLMPWRVLLRTKGEVFCVGAVVSAEWVLTAAHCVKGPKAEKQRVHFSDTRNIEVVPAVSPPHQTRRISDVRFHDQLDECRDSLCNHDWAMIRLNEKLDLNGDVKPVCLTRDNFQEQYFWHERHRLGVVANKLDTPVTVEVLESEDAPTDIVKKLKDEREFYLGNTFFARSVFSTQWASDSGDSGAPLVAKKDGMWFLVGVVSLGENQGKSRTSLFVRIDQYVDQILTHLDS